MFSVCCFFLPEEEGGTADWSKERHNAVFSFHGSEAVGCAPRCTAAPAKARRGASNWRRGRRRAKSTPTWHGMIFETFGMARVFVLVERRPVFPGGVSWRFSDDFSKGTRRGLRQTAASTVRASPRDRAERGVSPRRPPLSFRPAWGGGVIGGRASACDASPGATTKRPEPSGGGGPRGGPSPSRGGGGPKPFFRGAKRCGRSVVKCWLGAGSEPGPPALPRQIATCGACKGVCTCRSPLVVQKAGGPQGEAFRAEALDGTRSRLSATPRSRPGRGFGSTERIGARRPLDLLRTR